MVINRASKNTRKVKMEYNKSKKMNKTNLIITLILIVTFGYSQERKGIHQREWEKHQNDVQAIHKKQFAKNIIPINKNKSNQKELSSAVFGYLPYWEHPGAVQYFQYDLLTHIAAFDFSANASDGSISNPQGWPWTSMINEAHTNGVKIIMCVVEFNDDDIHTIITNSTIKNNFFANVKSKIETYNLDGVNIDFEGLYYDDRSNNINPFMSELAEYIHANVGSDQEVSFAGPAVNWSSWDLPGLAFACDYIFIMGYGYWWSGSSTAGPVSPIDGSNYNVTRTLTDVSKGYGTVTQNNPEKLILGIPYYGRKWQTSNQNEGSSVVEHIDSKLFSSAQSESETYGLLWSTNYKVPWYTYQSNAKYYQVWFDNATSLGLKYDLAIEKNLKGVGMWALGYDGSRDELWNKLREKFSVSNINDNNKIPDKIKLFSNYPNPFNPTTTIEYEIPNHNLIQLNVYNLIGEKIATLVNGYKIAGNYSVEFDGSNLSSGIYVYVLKVGQISYTKKMVLLK